MEDGTAADTGEQIPQPMQTFLESLDESSRSIITCLTHRKYADINGLAHTTGIPHHDVLRRINGVILPQSRRILGTEIVVFENARLDPATGRNIIFSWWIETGVPLYIDDPEVFEDANRILLIADVPGLDIPEPFKSRVHYRNGVLEIELSKDDDDDADR